MNDDSITAGQTQLPSRSKDRRQTNALPSDLSASRLLLGVLSTLKRVFSPRILLPGNMLWDTSPGWFQIQMSWQSNSSHRQSRTWVPNSSPVGLQIPTLNSATRFSDNVRLETNPLTKCYNQPQRVPELWPRFVCPWCIMLITGDASRPSPGHL